jgi:hypothetical protein
MKFYFQTGYRRPAFIPKLLLVMKLTLVLLITTFYRYRPRPVMVKKLPLKGTNVSFEKFFQVIQTKRLIRYYMLKKCLQGTKNADVELNNASVEDALMPTLRISH